MARFMSGKGANHDFKTRTVREEENYFLTVKDNLTNVDCLHVKIGLRQKPHHNLYFFVLTLTMRLSL